MKNLPAENIWNLEKTNLTDDPGKRRVICRCGIKYPEKVCNFSKSSTSLMMCSSAAGELLGLILLLLIIDLKVLCCQN